MNYFRLHGPPEQSLSFVGSLLRSHHHQIEYLCRILQCYPIFQPCNYILNNNTIITCYICEFMNKTFQMFVAFHHPTLTINPESSPNSQHKFPFQYVFKSVSFEKCLQLVCWTQRLSSLERHRHWPSTFPPLRGCRTWWKWIWGQKAHWKCELHMIE